MSLTGIILAAGESRRMGTPKALLELDGETFLDRLILTLGGSCSSVIVVLGSEAQKIRAGLRSADQATFVNNAEYQRGQLSSLQCGLAAVPAEADGVMFTLVDHPGVLPSTVARIARRFHERAPQESLVIPCCGRQRGHPVCVARELIPEFLALPSDAQARDVIHRHREHAVYLDVEDHGILDDIDDPETYQHLTGRAPLPEGD
jgi:CTP:molybdopterin cytidylyltransferase MocA